VDPSAPVTLVALSRVNDCDAWRKTYDSKAEFRRAADITRESVRQAIDDPNNVLVVYTFGTADQPGRAARAPPLRDAIQESGVAGPPRMELHEHA
jgi:hypothetical protein